MSHNLDIHSFPTRRSSDLNAYITIRPSKSIGLERPFFSVTGGKFSVNFFRPRAVMGSELIFDEDLTPEGLAEEVTLDRKSTRLNPSHSSTSYAVFCLKKKK